MKKRFAGAIFFLTFAVAAFADENPIYPVHVVLTVDPNELVAVVRMQAVYMNDEILEGTYSTPLSGTDWPAATVECAKTYVENCFTLQLNGRTLAASSFAPRFIQEPIRAIDPEFVFTLRYPWTDTGGRLSGRAAFFAEARHDGPHIEFITYLSVVGKETVRFELPLDKPTFELSLDGMTRPASARLLERMRQISFQVISSPFFWIVLIFAIVQAIKRWKKRKSAQ